MSLPTRSRDSWLPGVVRRQPAFPGGLRDWLRGCDWSPESGMTNRRVSMAVHSIDPFVDSCVNDAIRLANAAFESAAAKEVASLAPHACAWQFIRYYYSAYFAANALMRLCGYACTNLTVIDCTSINEQAMLYGVGGLGDRDKIAPGLYYARFDSSKTPTVTLRASSSKGGVHIQFWVGFLAFLGSLKHDINKSSAPKVDQLAALTELAALTAELQRSGTQQGSWLSEMRNAVNYRFEHGLWFPYDDAQADRTTLLAALKNGAAMKASIINMSASTPETVRATRSCAYLLAWLHDSMKIIENVAKGKKKQLIADGALAFAAKL